MYRLLFPILILFLSINSSLAQSEAAYHIRQFTTDDGLPSNGIKGMQWDEQTGFLWIATEAGMARYNGLGFSNFTRENTPGLSQERMAYIVKNNKGSIFTADVGGNILEVKANRLVYQPLPLLKNVPGFKKRHWLSISGEKLRQKVLDCIVRSGTTQWESILQINDSAALITAVNGRRFYTDLLSGREKELFIPAEYRGFFKSNGQVFATDIHHNIWMVKNNFQVFDPVKVLDENDQPVARDSPNFLLFWDNGTEAPVLFSGTNAWLLHYTNGILRASLICAAIPSYSFIRTVQYSKKNRILFIGTDSKGIIIINENRVTSVKKKGIDIRERNAYYSQVELTDNNILTNEGHVLGFKDTGPGRTPIAGTFGYTTYKSGDSLLWYSQFNKQYGQNLLHRYDYKTGKTLVYANAPVVQESFAITAAEGKLYFASSKGFGILQGDSLQLLFTPAVSAQPWTAPYMMTEFSAGVIGAASCSGLVLYDLAHMTTDTLLNFPGYCVRSLWRYKEYIFIGTYGKGYFVWKNGAVKPMPLDKNNFLLYTHCFVPDTEGYCWISTNRGLFKAQISDLLYAYEKNTQQLYYHYYGRNDGMEITEMNGGCAPCALTMRSGTLSFPTMDGLLWVNPDRARPLLPEGNIYIDEFFAGSNKADPDSLSFRSIPFSARDVLIKLGFSSWCNKENIYIDYRLGNSERWVPVDVVKGAIINLNNLLPGKYKLHIRKLNGFGINNYSYKEINFTIRTPWQRQWWFFVLCGAVLFGLTAAYLQFRTKQYKIRQRKLEQQVAEKTKELQQQNEILEKNNTIKTRLISIISHDIVTPLKFLTVAGKNLLEKRKLMNDELQQETIQEMANTSQELQLLSTNILNWIKYQNENRRLQRETFSIHELVNQVTGVLKSLAKQKKIQLVNDTDPALKIHQYQEPLKILIYNLVSNAINFSEQGNIVITNGITDGHLHISVKDEGVGMTKEQIQNIMADQFIISSANIDNRKGNGLGYLIIKDLLKTLGATIRIDSEKGKGTTVFILIPAQTDRPAVK